MKEIVLFGAGSSIIVDFEETCARLQTKLVAIVNNLPAGPSSASVHALAKDKVVALEALPVPFWDCPVSIALFTPGYRKSAAIQARNLGVKDFCSLIDPTSIVPRSMSLGAGVYVNAGTVIGGAVSIGDFAFVSRGVSLGHHCSLGQYSSIGPGVVTGGHVTFGEGSTVGTGAVILPEVRIGANAIVAAGAVVAKDVADNCMVAGNPARLVKENVPGYNNTGV